MPRVICSYSNGSNRRHPIRRTPGTGPVCAWAQLKVGKAGERPALPATRPGDELVWSKDDGPRTHRRSRPVPPTAPASRLRRALADRPTPTRAPDRRPRVLRCGPSVTRRIRQAAQEAACRRLRLEGRPGAGAGHRHISRARASRVTVVTRSSRSKLGRPALRDCSRTSSSKTTAVLVAGREHDLVTESSSPRKSSLLGGTNALRRFRRRKPPEERMEAAANDPDEGEQLA
jgi:hypothetical protein